MQKRHLECLPETIFDQYYGLFKSFGKGEISAKCLQDSIEDILLKILEVNGTNITKANAAINIFSTCVDLQADVLNGLASDTRKIEMRDVQYAIVNTNKLLSSLKGG